ncbi:MAG: chemotaxis protein CheW [Pseudomonadales bacterium]|nr:chemotaxis protein CheW [Pseudomonadales bacterium]
MSDHPYQILAELAERSGEVFEELPAQENTQMHWTGIGFDLLDQRCVVSMDEVAELMRVPAATRIPGAKSHVLGVANVRGRLMTIVDLAIVFGERSKLPRAQRRVLAFEEGESLVGFIVDESLGMQHFPRDGFTEDIGDLDDKFRPFTRGNYRAGGTDWPIMSLSALAQDPELEKLALMGN